MKWLNFTLGSAVVLAAIVLTTVRLGSYEIRRLNAEKDALEAERKRLVEYAERLSATHRVAQVEVIKQQLDPDGRVMTTLLWQEVSPDGIIGQPLARNVFGKQIYVEAMVLKFEAQLVGNADEGRSTSLALFRRVFGDQQTPESAPELTDARPPAPKNPPSPTLADALWAQFWELVDDPTLARKMGVRVAQCEAPSVPMKPGEIWEVSLDAVGGLNLRKLQSAKRRTG